MSLHGLSPRKAGKLCALCGHLISPSSKVKNHPNNAIYVDVDATSRWHIRFMPMFFHYQPSTVLIHESPKYY